MTDDNEESIVYDVLGLKPFWIETQNSNKPHNQSPSGEKKDLKKKFLLKEVKINNQSCLFVAPCSFIDSLASLEYELFKKISAYINTIGESNKKNPEIMEVAGVKSETDLSDFIFFLGQDLPVELKEIDTTNSFMASIALEEMIENPEKKRKLWQDIKELIKVIKK